MGLELRLNNRIQIETPGKMCLEVEVEGSSSQETLRHYSEKWNE